MNPNQPPQRNQPNNTPPPHPNQFGGRGVLPPPSPQQLQQMNSGKTLKKQFWLAMGIVAFLAIYISAAVISTQRDAEQREESERAKIAAEIERETERRERTAQREAEREEQRRAEEESPLPQVGYSGVAAPVMAFISSSVHDPRSVQYVWASPLYTTGTEGVYRQTVRFRAKNAFGAVVLTELEFHVSKTFAWATQDLEDMMRSMSR